MTTINQMERQGDDIHELYSELEDQVFQRIIAMIQDTSLNNVDKDNVLMWQMEQLQKAGMLTSDVIKMVANMTGKTQDQLTDLVVGQGMQVATEMQTQVTALTGKPHNVKPSSKQLLTELLQQSFDDLNNIVHQSLVTRNAQNNSAVKMYQDIINQSTVEVLTGLKTHEKAIQDNVYKWRKKGLQTNLVDKGGHSWSIDGYSRMVINSATHRAFNETRLNVMDENDMGLAAMSSHMAARDACAPIQGRVVNIVSRGDPKYNPKYPTIYDYGYGEASGTQGVNCRHTLTPYIEGVSTNPYKHPDTTQSVLNAEIQGQQRALERMIRKDKSLINDAAELHDDLGLLHYKNLLKRHQAKVRSLVNKHDFLNRDYSREKVLVPGNGHYAVADRTKVRIEKQNQHIKGTKAYNERVERDSKQGKYPSYLTIDNRQIQAIVDAKFDERKALHRYQYIDAGSSVGHYVTKKNGVVIDVPTTRLKLHQSKRGAHVVPANPVDQKRK